MTSGERGKDSMITEEARQMVGRDFVDTMTFEVEKGDIRRMAEAVDDPNPLWQDEEYAGKSKYGSIVAPPVFLMSFGLPQLQDAQMSVPIEAPRLLAGGVNYEYFEPVKPGDTITVQTKLSDLKEVETKLGKMVLILSERTFTNQRGQVVTRETLTIFRY